MEPGQDENIFCVLTEGLNEREVFILEHRILGSLSLVEVGERYGISKERVRQLEKAVKKKLLLRLIRSRNNRPFAQPAMFPRDRKHVRETASTRRRS